MTKAVLICTLFLTGCGAFDDYECVDGVIYKRMGNILMQSGLWANTKCLPKGKS